MKKTGKKVHNNFTSLTPPKVHLLDVTFVIILRRPKTGFMVQFLGLEVIFRFSTGLVIPSFGCFPPFRHSAIPYNPKEILLTLEEYCTSKR